MISLFRTFDPDANYPIGACFINQYRALIMTNCDTIGKSQTIQQCLGQAGVRVIYQQPAVATVPAPRRTTPPASDPPRRPKPRDEDDMARLLGEKRAARFASAFLDVLTEAS